MASSGAALADVGDILNRLDDRLVEVEQTLTSPDVMTGPITNEFPHIIIGGVVVDEAPPTPATNLVLSSGSYMSDIWIDASWTASPEAISYEVLVAEKSGSTYLNPETFRTSGTTLRIQERLPNKTYGVRVAPINRLGIRGTELPVAPGFQDVATGVDTTIPGSITGFIVAAGVSSISASWTKAPESDVRTYRVQLSTLADFSVITKEIYSGSTIVSFTALAASTLYYARVRAYDDTGNEGPWTPGSSATTASAAVADGSITEVKIADDAITSPKIAANAVTAAEIAAGVISSDKIIAAGLDASVIKFGSMSGDRITANTLDINAIKASTLTAKDITLGAGGQFKAGNPPTTGLLFNDQGIRLYNAGVANMILDAISGTATFKGTVDSATIIGSSIDIGGGKVKMNATNALRIAVVPGTWDPSRGIEWYDSTAPTKISRVYGLTGQMVVEASDFIDFNADTQHFADGAGANQWLSHTKYDGATEFQNTSHLFRVYKGWVHLYCTGDVSLANAGTSGVTIGDDFAANIGIDGNEIMARDGATLGAATLNINFEGGDVTFNASPNGVTIMTVTGTTGIKHSPGGPWSGAGTAAAIDASGYLRRNTSSIRYKFGVRALRLKESPLLKLEPIRFKYRKDGPESPDQDKELYGFSAEQVYEVEPTLVYLDTDGRPDAIDWHAVSALQVAVLQDHNKRLDELEKLLAKRKDN